MIEVSCFLVVWLACNFLVFLDLILRCLRIGVRSDGGEGGLFFIVCLFLLKMVFEILCS